MNYFRQTYVSFKNTDYYSKVASIRLKQVSSRYRELMSGLFLKEQNFKHLIRNYQSLKYDISLMPEIGEECAYFLRDFLYSDSIVFLSSEDIGDVILLVTSLLVNEGSMKIGSLEVANDFTRAIDIIFNPKITAKHTNELCCKLLGIKYRYTPTDKLYNSVKNKLIMYWWGLLEPTILAQEIYTTGLVHSNVSSSNQLTYFKLSSLYKKELMTKYPNTIIDRKGFLPAEDKIGKIVSNHNLYEFYIQEIVSSRGIKIIYNIIGEENVINIIEDYVTDNTFIILSSPTVRTATLEEIVIPVYMDLKEQYVNIVNNLEKSIKEVEVTDFEDTQSLTRRPLNKETVYKEKLICVAPYRRKLPLHQKRSKEKYDLALRFNIILKDDETFVDKFIRRCRVSKSTEISQSLQGVVFSEE